MAEDDLYHSSGLRRWKCALERGFHSFVGHQCIQHFDESLLVEAPWLKSFKTSTRSPGIDCLGGNFDGVFNLNVAKAREILLPDGAESVSDFLHSVGEFATSLSRLLRAPHFQLCIHQKFPYQKFPLCFCCRMIHLRRRTAPKINDLLRRSMRRGEQHHQQDHLDGR